MPLRILTDEHISPKVARRLAKLGFDVVCVHDRKLLHLKDPQLMRWCIDNQYAICTNNRSDFEEQHRHRRDKEEDHYGILIIGEWKPEETYWALRQYLASDPDPNRSLKNQVEYLPPATPEFISDHSGEE